MAASAKTVWDTETRDQALLIFQVELQAGASGEDGVGTTSHSVSGVVKQIFVEPGSGADAPTDLWDLVITDAPVSGTTGPDLTNGQGANLSGSANTTLGPSDLKGGMIAKGQLKATASNMGNDNKMKVTVYLLRFR